MVSSFAVAMSQHHQTRILLAVVLCQWDRVEELVRIEPVDPERFPELCRAADVHPGVHANLVRDGRGDLVGAQALSRLATLRAKVRVDNMLLLARAEQCLDILRDAGVNPVALKGLDLLHRVYGRFDERTLDDVDLLVRPDELQPAIEALGAAGWETPSEEQRVHYIRSSHHLPMHSPGPVPVEFEIHWNLVQEDRYQVDCAGIFERALPMDISGRTVMRMDDHDMVAHLLLHHFTHYFDFRLKWLLDLQKLTALPGFSWQTVIERIRSWKAVVASGMSAVHLRKISGEVVPEEVVRGLPVAAWRRALLSPLHSSHPLELFRGTRSRSVQLYLAAVLLERPWQLPSWLLHRALRDRRRGDNPLDNDSD